jgi:hypothetical protein
LGAVAVEWQSLDGQERLISTV